MSTALSQAIYARLAGTEILTGSGLAAQQQLGALLGTDPDTSKPAVLFGNKNDAPNVYPVVTFRPAPGVIDGRFADGLALDNSLYDFEIWENTRQATVLTDIAEQVERLLDMRRQIAPALPTAAGRLYWSEASIPLTLLYDDRAHAWCGLMRYRFVEARY